jgi:hypothetical protein
LGGVFNDANTRIEPSEVAGFNQTFRTIIPESVLGPVAGTEFETWNVGFEQSFASGTYFDVEGQWLNSKAPQTVGDLTNHLIMAIPDSPSSTVERLAFHEKTLFVGLHQLVGNRLTIGARYRLSSADLDGVFTEVPFTVRKLVPLNQNEESNLHQLALYANYNLPCGFFSQFQSIWSSQSNVGFAVPEPGDDFWHFNLFAGYRFPHRHAEIRLGILNLTDRDYGLEPLNFFIEMPHRRTFTVSFKFNF